MLQLANRGAGNPDGGLFTKEQWDMGNEQAPLLGQIPARGVIEVKPTSDDTWLIAESKQVSKYWIKYQLVLVTNYRDFVLVGKDRVGKPVKLESYRLASSELAFWTKVNHPQKFSKECAATFVEYLRRAMLHAAPITSPKDLAWFLASYARTASARLEGKDIPAMKSVRSALEAALGLRFEGAKGEHFFRSTLVQTIFYGLFSAWVLWHKNPGRMESDAFNWHDALWELKVPVMQALFGQIVTPEHIGPLELEDLLDWATSTLNRVDRKTFFSAFEEGKAVQYFYEPFLDAFDPELRKQLGVWYTPPEIVRYMVSRIDTVLRQELNIADGLADPNVYILDPCCGTGSYLVEVIRHIYQTLQMKGADALLATGLKQAVLKRVFGFEILPAPFVVSHMQLGLLLQSLGAPLSDASHERAGVYLTNALTGWEPLDPEKEKAFQTMLTGFPQLLEEQTDARRVKQQVPILVILGNPPYNAFAGTATTREERDSIAPYKKGLIEEWGIKKFNLDELYVRFFRMAEKRIAEQTGRGIVSFISHSSFISDPSFVVMRKRFIDEFDLLWIDNMNGDSRATGKRTPDGRPDPSVFSTDYNRQGIKVGTSICILLRKPKHDKPLVRYRGFWGASKRSDLLDSLDSKNFNDQYAVVTAKRSNRFNFLPEQFSSLYDNWPSAVDLAKLPPYPAFMESRRGALVDIEKSSLKTRLSIYFNKKLDWPSLKLLPSGLTTNSPRFNAEKAREKILNKEDFDESRIKRYTVRPFDVRWCYYTSTRPLWNEPRPDLYAQYWDNNAFFITRLKTEKEARGSPFYFSRDMVDCQCLARNVSVIPFGVYKESLSKKKLGVDQIQLPGVQIDDHIQIANISNKACDYLNSVMGHDLDNELLRARILWMHALAMGYSQSYLSENADGIRLNWPRIPLPLKKQDLESSAELGEKIATLLDTEKPVVGVTAGSFRSDLKDIAVIAKEGGGQLQSKDLNVTVGWGHAGQDGVVMPGKGKSMVRDYAAEEKESILVGAKQSGLSEDKLLSLLGDRTLDVYINDVAYWRNVPVKVWEYYIGGYQVIKKWLSYRESSLLGRPLTIEEVHEVTNMVRRIAALILFQPTLNANYKKCKEIRIPGLSRFYFLRSAKLGGSNGAEDTGTGS